MPTTALLLSVTVVWQTVTNETLTWRDKFADQDRDVEYEILRHETVWVPDPINRWFTNRTEKLAWIHARERKINGEWRPTAQTFTYSTNAWKLPAEDDENMGLARPLLPRNNLPNILPFMQPGEWGVPPGPRSKDGELYWDTDTWPLKTNAPQSTNGVAIQSTTTTNVMVLGGGSVLKSGDKGDVVVSGGRPDTEWRLADGWKVAFPTNITITVIHRTEPVNPAP